MLALVGLSGFEARSIDTLSGGEAQRVALARALAPHPRVLLLDEPFGSLDRRLRDRLVGEIPPILRAAEVAAVHVTHDHDEAFAIADRIAVMTAGHVLRIDDPVTLFADPRTEEVARFLTGGRPAVIVAPPAAKTFELAVQVPVPDMANLENNTIWPDVEARIVDLIEAHTSTIVFANSRRVAERLTARINEIHAQRNGVALPTAPVQVGSKASR